MMNIRILLVSFLLTIITNSSVSSQEHHGAQKTSPYAGFESREIKSLSADDIEELQRGGGWGLALPAELNGVPGPAHLLELKEEIGLTPDQVTKIEAVYAEMKSEAIEAGQRLIATEQAIENAFVAGNLDEKTLARLIDEAAAVRAELRFVHLSRHLLMPPLLSDHQIKRYSVLRGYHSDPCSNVPEGHDADI